MLMLSVVILIIVMRSVDILSFVMLSVVMQSVVMLSVVIQSVVILSVVASSIRIEYKFGSYSCSRKKVYCRSLRNSLFDVKIFDIG